MGVLVVSIIKGLFIFMNRKYLWFWLVLIAILAFFTRELVIFMMLVLILLTLIEISDELKKRNGRS